MSTLIDQIKASDPMPLPDGEEWGAVLHCSGERGVQRLATSCFLTVYVGEDGCDVEWTQHKDGWIVAGTSSHMPTLPEAWSTVRRMALAALGRSE